MILIIVATFNSLNCTGSSGDSVKILSVSVTPDPPEKGQKVMADVKLQFSESSRTRFPAALFRGSSRMRISTLNFFLSGGGRGRVSQYFGKIQELLPSHEQEGGFVQHSQHPE